MPTCLVFRLRVLLLLTGSFEDSREKKRFESVAFSEPITSNFVVNGFEAKFIKYSKLEFVVGLLNTIEIGLRSELATHSLVKTLEVCVASDVIDLTLMERV